MKRLFITVLIAALLCACATPAATPVSETEAPAAEPQAPEATEEPAAEPAAEEPYAKRVVAAWDAEGLLEGFTPYQDEDLLDLYGIDLSACISGAGFSESLGYVREIVIVEAESAVADEAELLLADHLESLKMQFRDYDPEAYAIAESAVLLREGNVVLLLVTPDAQKLEQVFADVDR